MAIKRLLIKNFKYFLAIIKNNSYICTKIIKYDYGIYR